MNKSVQQRKSVLFKTERFFLIQTWLVMLLISSASVIAEDPTRGSREFHANLSAENQTRLTVSPASGLADFSLDLATLTLSWSVSYQDMSASPTGITLHGPAQPGSNGVVFIDLAPDGVESPLRGAAEINEAQIQYLLAGWAYINVTSDRFPHGEIRGQLDVGRRR